MGHIRMAALTSGTWMIRDLRGAALILLKLPAGSNEQQSPDPLLSHTYPATEEVLTPRGGSTPSLWFHLYSQDKLSSGFSGQFRMSASTNTENICLDQEYQSSPLLFFDG